jgi:hypothetical protein
MTRAEIVAMFRADNTDIPERVISNAKLHNWALVGDKLVCAISRCIVTDVVFNSVVTTSVYNTRFDLTDEIDKFYDIDENPGGGVSFDDDPLDKTTVAELDSETPTWRTRSAGTPSKYYRRGKYVYFDRPIKTADLEIRVYAVLISDDFSNDNIMPYNQLTYLEPFHNGINKYLTWQAKLEIGKPQEAAKAEKDFYDFTNFMKRMITGGKVSAIRFQPGNYYQPTR